MYTNEKPKIFWFWVMCSLFALIIIVPFIEKNIKIIPCGDGTNGTIICCGAFNDECQARSYTRYFWNNSPFIKLSITSRIDNQTLIYNITNKIRPKEIVGNPLCKKSCYPYNCYKNWTIAEKARENCTCEYMVMCYTEDDFYNINNTSGIFMVFNGTLSEDEIKFINEVNNSWNLNK